MAAKGLMALLQVNVVLNLTSYHTHSVMRAYFVSSVNHCEKEHQKVLLDGKRNMHISRI